MALTLILVKTQNKIYCYININKTRKYTSYRYCYKLLPLKLELFGVSEQRVSEQLNN